MRRLAEISYEGIEQNEKFENITNKIYEVCFKEENLFDSNFYVSVIISDEKYIKQVNSEYRGIDSVTDVLSFPMFEKGEIDINIQSEEVLGDIIVCIPRVISQADEYGHGFDREFAYMLVHGFYHLMGYDHMEENEKIEMRAKEENVLKKVGFERIDD